MTLISHRICARLMILNTLSKQHKRLLLSSSWIHLERRHISKIQAYGNLLSGISVAQDILIDLREQVLIIKRQNLGLTPHLAIVQVGNREDSNVYVRMKLKAAEKICIKTSLIPLSSTTNQAELLDTISYLNSDSEVHGIIIQMPLDSVNFIDTTIIANSVSPAKDVDGLSAINQGKLAVGDLVTGFLPCTASGVLELINRTGVNIEGSHAVVVGRSKIVGTPTAEVLKWNDATVTVCHTKTKFLPQLIKNADILVVGIGQPQLIKGDWLKQGAVVIDCGINSIPDLRKKSGKRLVGDVDFEEAQRKASWITPVPGGVGPMTVAMLMKNTVLAAVKRISLDK